MLSRISSLLMICKAKGFLSAYNEVKGNWLYDIINFTDTAVWLPTEAYSSKYDTTNVIRYQATHTNTIDRAIKVVAAMKLTKPKLLNLVDLGSGKGKVLARSAQLGLTSAVGVELNTELHKIAKSNIDKVTNRNNMDIAKSVNEDCVTYLKQHCMNHVDIVFMYNPFTGEVMDEVLRTLRHKKERGASFVIAYVNPEQHEKLTHHFVLTGSVKPSGGQEINFYQ